MATEEKIIKITIDDKEALVRIDNISKKLDTLGSKETEQKKQLNAERKELIKSLVDEEKLQRERVKTLIEQEKLEQKKIQTTNASNKQAKVTEGYLNEVRSSVKALEQAYFQLTEAEFKNAKSNVQGTKGAQVIASLKEQRAVLAEAEAAYGKHNLNVGNYSSATKMLGINLGQVMKEMPNFAISARIGIMSLTNNLPMLAESIQAVKLEQKAMIETQKQLIAQGKIQEAQNMKIPNTWKMIGASMFGLTGVMSILMVVMQIWGADFIKWLFKGEVAVKKLTAAQIGLLTTSQTLHKVMKDGGNEYKTAISQIEKLSVTLRKSKGDTDLEKGALDEYNTTLGVTFGKVKDVDSALKLIDKNKKAYIQAMQDMAFANAFFAQSAEDAIKVMEVNLKSNAEITGKNTFEFYNKEITRLDKIAASTKKRLSELVADGASEQQIKVQSDLVEEYEKKQAATRTSYNNEANKERVRQIGLIQAHQKVSLAEATKYYEQSADAYIENNWRMIDDDKDKSKKKKNITKLEFEVIDKILFDIFEKNDKYNKSVLDNWEKGLNKYVELQRKALQTTVKQLEDSFKEEDKLNDDNVNDINNYLKIISDAKVDANQDDFAFRQAEIDQEYNMRIAAAKKVNGDTFAIEQAYKVKSAMLTAEKFNAQLSLVSSFIKNTTGLYKDGTQEQKRMTTAQILVDGVIAGYQAFNVAAYKSGIPAPYNYVAGGLAAAGVAVATGKAIKDVWAVDENGGSSAQSSTSQVTEKYHTGKEANSLTPNSQLKSDEIHSTLQIAETVLDPRSSNVFNSILGNIKMLGGSENITKSVGINADAQMQVMEIAFTRALARQKAPILDYSQFTTFVNKQVKFEQNTRI